MNNYGSLAIKLTPVLCFASLFVSAVATANDGGNGGGDQTPLIVVIVSSLAGTATSLYAAWSQNNREERKLSSQLQGSLVGMLQSDNERLREENAQLDQKVDELQTKIFEMDREALVLETRLSECRGCKELDEGD